jgi:hypothetical protein
MKAALAAMVASSKCGAKQHSEPALKVNNNEPKLDLKP